MRTEPKEEWKDIDGYEGIYQISNTGRIRSLDRMIVSKNGRRMPFKGRELSPSDNGIGYLIITLTNSERKRKSMLVHRLVATAFLSPVDGSQDVNHIDLDKTNNDARNLEWCTKKQNSQHTMSVRGNYLKDNNKDKCGSNNYNSKEVHQYDHAGTYMASFPSITDAQHMTGVSRGAIYKSMSRKRSFAGGYYWNTEKCKKIDLWGRDK